MNRTRSLQKLIVIWLFVSAACTVYSAHSAEHGERMHYGEQTIRLPDNGGH